MSDSALLSRVYDVKVAGFETSLSNLKQLTEAFKEADAAKIQLDASLKNSPSTSGVSDTTAKNKDLLAAMKALALQHQITAKETLSLTKAEQEATKQKILQEKVLQEQIKTQKLKSQESERSEKLTKAEQKSVEDLSNDYKILATALKEAEARYARLYFAGKANTEAGKEALQQVKDIRGTLDTLDQSMGNHQRNVGNYSSAFTNYANTLRGLRGPTKLLGEWLNIGAQEADQFRLVVEHAFQGIAAFFRGREEKAAAEVKDTVVTASNTAATETNTVATQEAAVAQTTLATSTTATSTAMKVLRIALLTTGIGILIGLIALIVVKYKEWKDSVHEAAKSQELINEVIKGAANSYQEAVKSVAELTEHIKLAKAGILDKEKVLHEYNDTLGKTIGKAKSLDEAEQLMVKNGPAYIQMMLLKAAANVALENAAKKAFEQELTRRKSEADFTSILDRSNNFNITSEADAKRAREQIKANAEERRKAQLEEQKKDEQLQKDIATKFFQDAAEISKNNKFDYFGGTEDKEKEKRKKADQLSADETNRLNIIEGQLKHELAIEETRFIELKRHHDLSYQEELDYINKVQAINVKYLDQKIGFLSGIKNKNAKEIEELDTFIKTKSEIQFKALVDTQNLNKRQFDEEAKLLKRQLDSQKSAVDLSVSIAEFDPRLSAEARATARKNGDNKILDLTISHYKKLEERALVYKQKTETIEEDKQQQVNEITKKGLNDNLNIVKGRLDDIDKTAAREVSKYTANFAKLRKAILDNDKLTTEQKKSQIDQLDRSERRTILSAELEALNKQVQLKAALLVNGLISGDEYIAALAAQAKKAEDLSKAADVNILPGRPAHNLKDLIQGGAKGKGGLRKSLGFKEGSPEDEVLGNVLAQSFDLATTAMNNYFDQERNRIEQSKQLSFERIDLEKQQRLNTAQSQAERDTIEKQAEEKKKKATKDAGEQLKKVKKAEAKISLATELANIAAAAAGNPLNSVTFGSAGAIMYGILAALALGRYALNVRSIDTQQFAGSGRVQNLRSGRITVAPNIPVQPNGDSVLATVKPGEVILNEDHQRRLGGSHTFRAIGVPGFASGGLVPVGGSMPGDSLRPPYNPASFLNNTASTTDIFSAINQQTANLNESARQIHERIDKLQVQVVAREVEDTNTNLKKASSIGRI